MADARQLTQDELDEWRGHPVTEWLLAVLRKGYQANKASLQAQLWSEGQCDPGALGRTKAQAELIEDMTEATCEDWNEWAKAFER